MPRLITIALLNALAAWPLRAQASAIIPPHARDSLLAQERRSPEALHARQRNLDSLAAGRRRWKLANVTEYAVQVHVECFCISSDSIQHFSIVTVRGGQIVGRAPGKNVGGFAREMTIDTLFAGIERDIRDAGRVVRRFQLDPRYGFPRDYYAETPSIPDLWIHILVDSFAIARPSSASAPPPAR